MEYDVLIVGGGPAGLSASVYAVRGGLKPLVITKEFGGRIKWAHKIENYLGTGVVSGDEYMEKAVEQAKDLGVKLVKDEVMSCEKKEDVFSIKTAQGKEYSGKALIIAMGIQDKLLKVPGEKELAGKGVSYCATCDGFFFKEQKVVVVGGGNAAIHAALFLNDIASNVQLVADEVSASDNMLKKLEDNEIEIVKGEVERIEGEEEVTGIVVDGSSIPASGVFIELGATATIDLAAELGFEMKGERFIKVDDKQATTTPGVFAAGDVTGGLLQIVTAVYQGAVAALSARNYIRTEKEESEEESEEKSEE